MLRFLRGLLLTTIIVALVVAGGFYAFSRWMSRTEPIDIKGSFGEKPQLTAEFRAADYGLSAFTPIYGPGNAISNAEYDTASLITGVDRKGNSQIISVNLDGHANWQVPLKARLWSCSQTDIDGSVPCLVISKSSSAIIMLDLKSGVSKWIYQAPYRLVGVNVSPAKNIEVIDSSLNLYTLSRDGTQINETLLPLGNDDPAQLSATAGCPNVVDGSRNSPALFKNISENIRLFSYGGMVRVLDVKRNLTSASTYGNVTETRDGFFVTNTSGCAKGMVVDPLAGTGKLLAKNVTIPTYISTDNTDVVLRDGQLHEINWTESVVGPALNPADSNRFDTAPALLKTKKYLIAADSERTIVYALPSYNELWNRELGAKNMQISSDVLLSFDTEGVITAAALSGGQQLWQIETDPGSFTVYGNQIQVASKQAIRTWSAGSYTNSVLHGDRGVLHSIQPGINYGIDTCVRVRKIKGDERNYTAQYYRVDCGLKGSEPLAGVVKAAEVPRGSKIEDFMKACEKLPKFKSVLTVNDPMANTDISALCTN